MTDMKQNKKAMSVQELEKVSGGKIAHPFYQPFFHPIVLGKRNDEGNVNRRPFISKLGF